MKRLPLKAGSRRARITDAKAPLLDAVKKIVFEMRPYWKLTVRQIHYLLLNDPPLIHARKPHSTYRNDKDSYRACIDICTRAPFEGHIPFEAIGDETRPVHVWNVHENVGNFIRGEMDNFLKGYFRNLMVSQPKHYEIIGEKNTIQGIIQPLAMDYCIPFTLGRGYCSVAPIREMALRFQRTGKDTLVLITVSDFDPEAPISATVLERCYATTSASRTSKLFEQR